MDKKTIASKLTALISIALFIFLATVNSARGQSLTYDLSAIDAFHPPLSGDPTALLYKEWHYFNILDEEQDLSFITTFMLQGDISNPFMSAAVNLMSYQTTPGSSYNPQIMDVYPIFAAQWSADSPDVTMGGNSVKLDDEGYHVYEQSQDAKTVFNAVFKPEADPASVFNVPLGDVGPGRVMNWMVASSKMTVNGTLTINKGTPSEKTYVLKNARGYHDHNWGHWLWRDDMGWDWAQATERTNPQTNDTGNYAVSLGNITNNSHTVTRSTVLDVWKNKGIISSFKDSEIQVSRSGMAALPGLPGNPYPTVTTITASSGNDNLKIKITTEQATPIFLPLLPEGINGYRIVWEITGKYEVEGNLNGKDVSFTTDGYLEYVGELLIF